MLYLLKSEWAPAAPGQEPDVFLGTPLLDREAGLWLLRQYAVWAGGLELWDSQQGKSIASLTVSWSPMADPLFPAGVLLQFRDKLGWGYVRLFPGEFRTWYASGAKLPEVGGCLQGNTVHPGRCWEI